MDFEMGMPLEGPQSSKSGRNRKPKIKEQSNQSDTTSPKTTTSASNDRTETVVDSSFGLNDQPKKHLQTQKSPRKSRRHSAFEARLRKFNKPIPEYYLNEQNTTTTTPNCTDCSATTTTVERRKPKKGRTKKQATTDDTTCATQTIDDGKAPEEEEEPNQPPIVKCSAIPDIENKPHKLDVSDITVKSLIIAMPSGSETETDTTVATIAPTSAADSGRGVIQIEYTSTIDNGIEQQVQKVMRVIQRELSEPYSIYTFRFFIYNWPNLCFLAMHGRKSVGAIVCRMCTTEFNLRSGYIAMLAVRKDYRKMKIGTMLVQRALDAMIAEDADEVALETETTNEPALRFYENLGFVRERLLTNYYLNGGNAFRMKMWFR